ncbi:MAG TPA: cupin domain-containing protein [Acidimicrobiales bacterium]|jgi:hypothetical protein|nr:cupin domain-containing protein [Acidimicrobiales bacterium]
MSTDTWRRATGGPSLGPRTVIHIDDALPAERGAARSESPITITPLTGDGCDLAVLTFTLPPNYVGKLHWHPADTVYVVRRGQFIVEGEGTYEVGDIRWVKAGTPYGPEAAGPDGCEVMLIAAGSFPLPTHDPAADAPPRGTA